VPLCRGAGVAPGSCDRPVVMVGGVPVLLVLDLLVTFAFALHGALTARPAAHLDIVGVIVLGVITATAAASSGTC